MALNKRRVLGTVELKLILWAKILKDVLVSTHCSQSRKEEEYE